MDHARVAVPPPLIFLACLLTAVGLNLLLPIGLPGGLLVRPAGAAIVIGGFVLAAWAVSRMRAYHTSPDPDHPTAALITDGPYRFTRNPIYVGFTLIVIGFGWAAGTAWGVLLAPLAVLAATRLVVVREEAYLSNRFGPAYEDYRSRVRRWL